MYLLIVFTNMLKLYVSRRINFFKTPEKIEQLMKS